MSQLNDLGNYLGPKLEDHRNRIQNIEDGLVVDAYESYASFANLPTTGKTNIFYITADTDKIYRWNGSSYIEVVAGSDNTFTAGTGINVTESSNSITISHSDTSTANSLSINNSNGTVIQDLSLIFDGFGHVTGTSATSIDLDNRYQQLSQKGIANGYASLDSNGLVPSSQLPSYVDDVLEFTNLAGFPGTGETSKIYVALDTNKIYRWSGSVYVEVSSDTNNFLSGLTFNTTDGILTATRSGLSNLTVDLDGRYSLSTHSHNYVSEGDTDFSGTYPMVARIDTNKIYSNPSLTYTGSTDTLNAVNIAVSGTVDGRDVSADGAKLDGIATGAEVNQNAFSNIAVSGQTTVAADGKTDTLTLVAGTNVSITTDATNDTITINANDTSVAWSEITGKPTTISGYGITDDPVITLTGAVTGTGTMTNLGSVSIATTATADPVLTLAGDATGSCTFTNLGNATLTVAITDDSHNHIISNIDGLQSALDSKLSTTGKAADSNLLDGLDSSQFLRSDTSDSMVGSLSLSGDLSVRSINANTNQQLVITAGEANVDSSQTGEFVYINAEGGLQVAASPDNWASGYAGTKKTTIGANGITYDGNNVFHDAYHPNADTLTTARTISLSGDATGSVSFNGSANVTIPVVIADDSHNHIIANVDGLQTALDGKLSTTGKAADSNLLDGIDSTSFLRSNVADTFTSLSGTSLTIGAGVTLGESADRADLLEIKSSTSGWGGIQITNTSNEFKWSFMGDGTTGGIYDDLSNTWHIQFIDGGGTRLYQAGAEKLTTTTTGVSITGTITESSDKRLKENIKPLNNSLNKVLNLQGVEYNLIEQPGKTEIGFIAQEVQEIVPELVETNEKDMLSVSYQRTVALLVEAMKEQQEEINKLKTEINSLKGVN